MGYHIVEFGKFTAIKGAGGYYLLNPSTVKLKFSNAYNHSTIQHIVNQYKKKNCAGLDIGIVETMIKMKLGGGFISENHFKSKEPEVYLYEQQIWKGILNNLEEVDVNFTFKSSSKSDIYDLLSAFLCQSEILFEGFDVVRIYKPSIGNKLGTFFTGEKHGKTLAMFPLSDIRNIEIRKDHLLLNLKENKTVSVYHHNAYQ